MEDRDYIPLCSGVNGGSGKVVGASVPRAEEQQGEQQEQGSGTAKSNNLGQQLTGVQSNETS